MVIIEIVGTLIKVRSRGDIGGLAKAHLVSAPVTFGLATEESQIPERERIHPQKDENLVVQIADGVIAVPTKNTTVMLTKGSAAAMTLANPSALDDGVEITIIGATDFAHVVTSSIFNGVTGGAKTTLTSPAFAGSAIILKAYAGRWYLKTPGIWVVT